MGHFLPLTKRINLRMITDLHAVSVKQIDKLILHLPFPNAFYVSVFCQLAF